MTQGLCEATFVVFYSPKRHFLNIMLLLLVFFDIAFISLLSLILNVIVPEHNGNKDQPIIFYSNLS